MPTRSFGAVDFKVAEADFFLALLTRSAHRNEWHPLHFNTSAFVSASRSITFAMQASLKHHPGFDEWYGAKRELHLGSVRARFFNEYRTASQKRGESVIAGGSFAGKRSVYHFAPIGSPVIALHEDVVTACEGHFRDVLRLVYDCYVDLAPIVNAQWRFTNEYFASIGLTIEDAEEELGYPRGWTASAGQSLAVRWRLLRQEADGCGIRAQFDSWLGLTLPHPDDED